MSSLSLSTLMSTINVNPDSHVSTIRDTSNTMSTVRDIVGEPSEKHTDAKSNNEEEENDGKDKESEESEESEEEDDPKMKKKKKMQVTELIEMDLVKTRDELLQDRADLYKEKDRLREKWLNIGLWKERLANKESAQLKLTDELWKREQKVIRDEKRLEIQKRDFRNLVASIQQQVNSVEISEDEQHVSATSTTPVHQPQFLPQQNQYRPRYQPCYRPPNRQVIRDPNYDPHPSMPSIGNVSFPHNDKKYNKYLKNRRNDERRYNNKYQKY